jgi:hypothetical protein
LGSAKSQTIWVATDVTEWIKMSLTSLVEIPEVRERFNTEFTKPSLGPKKELLAAPLTKSYSTVGTGFDYLLRFYVKRLNPKAIDKRRWIAENSMSLLRHDERLFNTAEKIVLASKENEAKFLESGEITDQLLESALSLAYIDPIYRAKRGHEWIGTPINPKDIEDLQNLISLVRPIDFTAKSICLLNPTFGMGSVLVGNADTDILLDDMIIDIKTTKEFQVKATYFRQMMGYYLLHEIAGIGELDPKPEVKRLGIYFSRQAHFYTINVDEVIDKARLPSLLNWFKETADPEYRKIPRLA